MDVKTAGRTLEIFEIFAKEQQPLSLSEMARALDAPASSCLYLVRTLENFGYLYSTGTRKGFYPTRKLSEIAAAISEGEPEMERVENILKNLMLETRETVILGKRQGKHIIFLSVFEGPQTIRYAGRTGDLQPLHSSSIGKALLGTMNPTERAKIIARLELEPLTAATITDPEVLAAEVETTAKRGYAVSLGESVADTMALAIPIKFRGDIYAFAVAGPIYRMKPLVDSHLQQMRSATEQILES